MKISTWYLWVSISLLTLLFLSQLDRNREYTNIRANVIMATGYDISYPEKWKGVCK